MRFRFETDDGVTGNLLDKGKVIARGIPSLDVQAAIQRRMAGDEWRRAIYRMYCSWKGHEARHEMHLADEWAVWISNRMTSFNERARGVGKAFANGQMRVRSEPVLRSDRRNQLIQQWDVALTRMSYAWTSEGKPDNEWTKWCSNTASNQRKRIRRKEERQAEGGSSQSHA